MKTKNEQELTETLEKLLDIYPRLKMEATKQRYQLAMVNLLDELHEGVSRGVYQAENLAFYSKYIKKVLENDDKILKKRGYN